MGFDSLMSIELKTRLESDLGVAVAIARLMQGPPVVELAGWVAQLLPERGTRASGSPLPRRPRNGGGRLVMDPGKILASLLEEGVALWAEGSRLRYRAEKGVMTGELRALLSDHKEAVLSAWRAAAAQTVTVHPATTPNAPSGFSTNPCRKARPTTSPALFGCGPRSM